MILTLVILSYLVFLVLGLPMALLFVHFSTNWRTK